VARLVGDRVRGKRGYWALLYLWFGQPLWYALPYPLGSLVLLIIAGGALRAWAQSGVEGTEYIAR
jgi:hypothetical protein